MEIRELKEKLRAMHQTGIMSREDAVTWAAAIPENGIAPDEKLRLVDLEYLTTDKPDILRFHLTDAGSAEYFTALYGDRLRYDYRRGRWLEWDGTRWREDSDNQVIRLALAATRARYKEAVSIPDLDERSKISKYTIEAEARARIDSCLALARAMKPIADSGERWDADPWLFCVKNGVIDLRTGQIRPGQQSDCITMQSCVAFDPEAKAPRWLQFLDEIHDGNREMITWEQKYYGYCLTGDTREQVLVINHGRGANGKSRKQAILRYVYGDYAYDAPFSTFELSNRAAIPNDLAALVGRRFVTSSETNAGTQLNVARIRALTGQDAITARFLHAEFFTFNPVAKYSLSVNDRPRVHDDSDGFWRRVRLIPYNRQFTGEADDKQLLDKLTAEAAGILNWLIEGCLKWQAEGLDNTPECVRTATTEYQADSDPLSEFILDECVLHTQAQNKSISLYKGYQSYCRDQGMTDKEIMSTTAFGRRMAQKFKKIHKEGGTVYLGIALRTDGLMTGFISNDVQNNVFPNSLYAREDNTENPSEPVNPSVKPVSNPSVNSNCPSCGKAGEFDLDAGLWRCICGNTWGQNENGS